MSNYPSFTSLSLSISEQEYREIPCLSYSKLSRFQTLGYEGLAKLDEPVSSASLLFGSLLDCLVTDYDNLNNRFVVKDVPVLSEKLQAMENMFLESYPTTKMSDIPTGSIDTITTACEYQLNWKPETRVNKVREQLAEYHDCMVENAGKTVVNSEMYLKATNCRNAILNHPIAGKWFQHQDGIEVLFQQKYLFECDGIKFKMMADIIVVNHIEKTIRIIDLKSSTSTHECYFIDNYIKWHYQIQSRLYCRGIKEIINGTEFENYHILPFTFLFVNCNNAKPIVYKDVLCYERGTICYNDGKIEFADPIEIASHLVQYINNPDKCISVDFDTYNDLSILLNNVTGYNKWKI